MSEKFLTFEEVHKTFERIETKLSSINYQVDYTIPQELSPWYIVLTELRLLFLSPFVMFSQKNKNNTWKPVHYNITKEDQDKVEKEFLKEEKEEKIIAGCFLMDYKHFWGEDFPNEKNKQWINSNLDAINGCIIFEFKKNYRVYIFTTYKPNKYSPSQNQKKSFYPPQKFPFNSMDEIKGFLKSKELPEDIKEEMGGGVGEYFIYWFRNRLFPYFKLACVKKDRLRKELFPIWKYKRYFLEEIGVFPEIKFDEIPKWKELISSVNRLTLHNADKVIKAITEIYRDLTGETLQFGNDWEKLAEKKITKYFNKLKQDSKNKSKALNEIEEFVKQTLIQHLHRLIKLDVFLSIAQTKPYFETLYKSFDSLHERIYSSLSDKYKFVDFCLHFITLDKDLVKTLLVTKSWYNYHKMRNDLTLNNFLKYIWEPRFIYKKEGGLSKYISESGYPEFIVEWKVINDKKTTDRRIYGLQGIELISGLKKQTPYEVFQIPVVYTRIALNGEDFPLFLKAIHAVAKELEEEQISEAIQYYLQREMWSSSEKDQIIKEIKRRTKKIKKEKKEDEIKDILRMLDVYEKKKDKKLFEPVYNFSFTSKLIIEHSGDIKKLRSFWQNAFDLSFETLFAAGTIQQEQNNLFKASLFEEATESFKKALKFPLIEPSER